MMGRCGRFFSGVSFRRPQEGERVIWIFGYGSLMYDRWEDRFGCTTRAVAELRGYGRVFNKASVKNWGTKRCPCPTLNIEPSDGAICVGIAFEFPESQGSALKTYLAGREGKSFSLRALEVFVRGADAVSAMVPLYTGQNILSFSTAEAFASTVLQTRGDHGACSDYLIGVRDQLAILGIEDPAVSGLAELLGGQPKVRWDS